MKLIILEIIVLVYCIIPITFIILVKFLNDELETYIEVIKY